MALIADLVTRLKVDGSELVKGLKKAQTDSEGFFSKMALSATVVAGAIATSMTAAFAGLGALISKDTKKISELHDAALRMGTSVGAFQALEYAAKQSGVSIGSVTSSVKLLMKNIASAADGNKTLQGLFSNLHLDPSQLLNMSADQQYASVADAIKDIPNAAEQARVAIGLLGRSGFDNLSLMKDDVRGLMAEFKSFGGELTDNQAKAVDDYGDSIGRLGTIWDAFGLQLTASVAKPLGVVVQWLIDTVKAMGGIGPAADKAAKFFISGVQLMITALQGLLDFPNRIVLGVEKMAKAILTISQWTTLGLSNIIVGAGDKIDELNADIDAREKQLANPITGSLQKQLAASQALLGGNQQSMGGNPLYQAGSTTQDLVNWQLGKTSPQQTVNVNVKVDTTPELVANVVNSSQNQDMITRTTSNIVSTAARGGLN